MKERPIIFNTDMVRAILDGRKTQTRRPVRPQPMDKPGAGWTSIISRWKTYREEEFYYVSDEPINGSCRNGWTREIIATAIPPVTTGERLWVQEAFAIEDGVVAYKADQVGKECRKWIPPLSMNRWASRLTLEVTGVRVERLQSISHAGAHAEGMESKRHFIQCWTSIYGVDAWSQNPWVWVIDFRRVEA